MTDTDELNRDGDDLHALMERAVTGLQAPIDRLGSAAVADGGRLRRRRRLGSALTTAAVVAVTALALPQLASDPTTTRDATVGPATSSPDEPQPADAWWDMPADQMFDVLGGLLPDGAEITAYSLRPDSPQDHSPARGWVGARLTVDGIEGTSSIEVLLYSPESLTEGASTDRPQFDANGDPTVVPDGPPRRDLITCPGNVVDPDSCEQIREHGEVVGRLVEDRRGDLVIRDVSLLHGDGMVYVAAANSTSEKWGRGSDVSASGPPLTLEQLRAIAEGPWSL